MQGTGLGSRAEVMKKSMHIPCPHIASSVGAFIEYLVGTRYGAENLT